MLKLGTKDIKKLYLGDKEIKKAYWGDKLVFHTTPARPVYVGAITALSLAREKLSAATVGNYALFGGGLGASSSAVVDAYNATLTRSTPTALSAARKELAATTIGNYALFGGGSGASDSAVVDAYTVA